MARSEVCKNCCPDGGAIFVEDFGVWPHVSTKVEMEEAAWVKVCQNCGHYKTKRKVKRYSLDEITALKTDAALRGARDLARFHYFSDSGAVKQYRDVCKQYGDLARENGITKYPLFLHAYFNDYHSDKIAKAATSKRPDARSTRYNIAEQKRLLEQAKAALAAVFLKSEAA